MRSLSVQDEEHWAIVRDKDLLQRFRLWAFDHGFDLSCVYRIEIHVIDCPMLRLFGYATENGEIITEVKPDGERDVVYITKDILMRSEPPVTFRIEE